MSGCFFFLFPQHPIVLFFIVYNVIFSHQINILINNSSNKALHALTLRLQFDKIYINM